MKFESMFCIKRSNDLLRVWRNVWIADEDGDTFLGMKVGEFVCVILFVVGVVKFDLPPGVSVRREAFDLCSLADHEILL